MNIQVIDKFLPDADKIREQALQSQYIDWQGPDGEVYKRICITDVPRLQEKIEEIMGPVDMLGMGYRLNFNLEEPNHAIHSDLGWGTHALVLYLSEGPSGTAFWKHKATDTVSITQGEVELFEQIKDDWNNEDAWEITKYVNMKFNRALIYESKLYHSRYPFQAFGRGFENGRLIAVAFFTPKQQDEYTIRPAVEGDLRRIIEMAERFYPYTSYWTHSRIPFDAAHAALLATAMIENGVMHMAEYQGQTVGMIGLVIMPFLFNPDYMHGGEIIWWVEPEHWKSGIGEQLLESIEAPCKEKNVRHIQMLDLYNSNLSAEKLYLKHGYMLTERSFTKVI